MNIRLLLDEHIAAAIQLSWSANQFVVPQTTPVASTCAVGRCNRDAGNTGSDMDHQIVPGLQLPSHHL